VIKSIIFSIRLNKNKCANKTKELSFSYLKEFLSYSDIIYNIERKEKRKIQLPLIPINKIAIVVIQFFVIMLFNKITNQQLSMKVNMKI